VNFDQEFIDSNNNTSSNLESIKVNNGDLQDSSISKENIPSFNKILIADNGKEGSNKVIALISKCFSY